MSNFSSGCWAIFAFKNVLTAPALHAPPNPLISKNLDFGHYLAGWNKFPFLFNKYQKSLYFQKNIIINCCPKNLPITTKNCFAWLGAATPGWHTYHIYVHLFITYFSTITKKICVFF